MGKAALGRYWTDNNRQTEETRGMIHYDRRPKAEMQPKCQAAAAAAGAALLAV